MSQIAISKYLYILFINVYFQMQRLMRLVSKNLGGADLTGSLNGADILRDQSAVNLYQELIREGSDDESAFWVAASAATLEID